MQTLIPNRFSKKRLTNEQMFVKMQKTNKFSNDGGKLYGKTVDEE